MEFRLFAPNLKLVMAGCIHTKVKICVYVKTYSNTQIDMKSCSERCKVYGLEFMVWGVPQMG